MFSNTQAQTQPCQPCTVPGGCFVEWNRHPSDAMLYSSLHSHGKTKWHGSQSRDKDSGARALGIKCFQGRVVGDSEGKQNSIHVGADYTESSGVPERSPSQGGRQWAATAVPATQWLSFSSSVPTLSSLRTVLRMKNRTRSPGPDVGKHKARVFACLCGPTEAAREGA